jgi:hypothetical protein
MRPNQLPMKEGARVARAKQPARTLTDVLREMLPAPVRQDLSDEGILLTAGDPGMVAVRVSDRGLVVSVFGIRWDGPHTPIRDDRDICRLSWNELPAELPEQAVVASALIQAALVLRRAQFRECRYCQRSVPPEWQHSADLCQGCAEQNSGVVH